MSLRSLFGLRDRGGRRGSGGRRDRRSPEERRFGTGLWRQHRERFARAVDRFYETVTALRGEIGEDRHADVEPLAQLTHALNALDERVAQIAESAQRQVPLEGLVFPASGRELLGDVPEQLSRASALVAQASQAAAMLRAHVRMGTATAGQAERIAASARSYVRQADGLLAAAEGSEPPSTGAEG